MLTICPLLGGPPRSVPWGSFSVTYREKEAPCWAQESYLCTSQSQWDRKGLGDPKVTPSLGL